MFNVLYYLEGPLDSVTGGRDTPAAQYTYTVNVAIGNKIDDAAGNFGDNVDNFVEAWGNYNAPVFGQSGVEIALAIGGVPNSGGKAWAAKKVAEALDTASDAAKLSKKVSKSIQDIMDIMDIKDMSVRDAILSRGSNLGNVKSLETGMAQKTVLEIAQEAAKGNPQALKALKIVKQAYAKGQKH